MRLQQILHLDDGEFVEARAAAEAQPAHTPQPPRRPYPGVSRDVLAELRRPGSEPVRQIDLMRRTRVVIVLGPVGRIRLERLRQLRREQTPVAQLCAAAGLIYAARRTADWNTMTPEKAQVA